MNAGISDSSASEILFFTAQIDERGRIIVPAAIRRKLGISFGSVVFAGVEKVKITLSGSSKVPKEEGGEDYEN